MESWSQASCLSISYSTKGRGKLLGWQKVANCTQCFMKTEGVINKNQGFNQNQLWLKLPKHYSPKGYWVYGSCWNEPYASKVYWKRGEFAGLLKVNGHKRCSNFHQKSC